MQWSDSAQIFRAYFCAIDNYGPMLLSDCNVYFSQNCTCGVLKKCLCRSLFFSKPHISLVAFIQTKSSVLRGISETRLPPWTLLDPGPSSIHGPWCATLHCRWVAIPIFIYRKAGGRFVFFTRFWMCLLRIWVLMLSSMLYLSCSIMQHCNIMQQFATFQEKCFFEVFIPRESVCCITGSLSHL